MTPLPLAEIGLSPSHHRSALWWLGLLYRRPAEFRTTLETLPLRSRLGNAAVLYVHALPYILLVVILGRLFLFDAIGLSLKNDFKDSGDPIIVTHAFLAAFGIALGIATGIGSGIIGWISVGISRGIAVWIAFGIFFGMAGGMFGGIAAENAFGIAIAIVGGISIGLAFGIAGEIDFGMPRTIAFGIVWGIASGIAGGIAFGIVFGIAMTVALLRVYYLIAHPFFLWPKLRADSYPRHPVAWDDLCAIRFPGLDRLLAAYAQGQPEAGEPEIGRLTQTYPSQRMSALRAKTRLIARRAATADLGHLDDALTGLPGGANGFLAQTRGLRDEVVEVARLQRRLNEQDRPFLRESTAAMLCKEIENLRHRLAGFPEPIASEFRAAAGHWLTRAKAQSVRARGWREIENLKHGLAGSTKPVAREFRAAAGHGPTRAKTQHEQARRLERAPTPQVFRAGDPVDRSQEAFVPRERVLSQIDRQLTLATGCPGLILYGRRRMGKSTLLRNLEGFLPGSVRVANVSMQRAAAFASQSSLLVLIAETARGALGHLGPAQAAGVASAVDFSVFLDGCDARLGKAGGRLLLALDEYEYLDLKLGEGVFDLDLLALIRESIQTHRNLTWVFAGSHAIDELTHADWTSYLVSARTIEVPGFSEAETRRLLTEPLRHSDLWAKDDPRRPRFDPGFWGEGGIAFIHTEAGAWPHLVQLLAETAVDLVNDDETRAGVDAALLERAANDAVTLGDTVLRQLMQPEEAAPGEWDYLRGFCDRETRSPPADDAVRRALRRRLLVAEDGDQWRLRVPLMQRWLRQRG